MIRFISKPKRKRLQHVCWSLFISILLLSACKSVLPRKASKQKTFIQAAKDRTISAHRGGRHLPDYPENCLETMAFLHDTLNCIMEVDLQYTADSLMILLHDKTLDRTTISSGPLSEISWKEIESIFLLDDFGNTTDYQLTKASEFFQWMKKTGALVTLDLKGIPIHSIIDSLRKHDLVSQSAIISYTMEQALDIHHLAPDIAISISIRNEDELNRWKQSKIPAEQTLAFLGTREKKQEFISQVKSEDLLTLLGTLGNLDQKAINRGSQDYYRDLYKIGIDILATDYPFLVHEALKN